MRAAHGILVVTQSTAPTDARVPWLLQGHSSAMKFTAAVEMRLLRRQAEGMRLAVDGSFANDLAGIVHTIGAIEHPARAFRYQRVEIAHLSSGIHESVVHISF